MEIKDVEDYLKQKNELERNIGTEKLKRITDEITKVIKENNLDCTPNVMHDVFEYIRCNILISKIKICH